MWQFRLASVLILGSVLVIAPAFRADELGDKLIGIWSWMAPPGDHDQIWSIANDGGKWTVRGWYKNDQGVETGSFVGVDAKYEDGTLTYTHRYIKKNFDFKDNVPAMIKVEGAFVKYYWDPNNPKTGRILGRQPKKPLNAVEKFVGIWKTQTPFAGYEQTITIGNERGPWSIHGTFLREGSVVGTTVGEDIKFAGGLMNYRAKFVKKPEDGWEDNVPTLRTDGETLTMSFATKGGEKIVRWFGRMSEEPKVVAKREPMKDPVKPTLPSPQVRFDGTWIGKVDGRWDEVWTFAMEAGVWKITGSYLKTGKEIGNCHGKDIVAGKETLTFTRVYDKRPVKDLKDAGVVFTVKDDRAEMVVGKIKGRWLNRVDPADVAKLNNPKTESPKTEPRRNDSNYVGPWTGTYPGTTHSLVLILTKQKDDWTVEGFVMSAEEKRLAYFKQSDIRINGDAKTLIFSPIWTEKTAQIAAETSFSLSSKTPDMHVEISEGKTTDKLVFDLSRMDPRRIAKLKPPTGAFGKLDPKVEVFKLPANTPAAKPFAVLDAKLYLITAAVSPMGKRVALGSRQTLDGKGFTADLSVWDINQKKQVWIKKKIVAEKDLGLIKAVAFSGDGKILAAVPYKADGEEVLRFFDAETGVERRSPAPLKMRIDSIAFHPSKGLLAIGTGGRLGLFNLNTGKTNWVTPQIHKVSINGLVFSPNGETIATCGWTTDGNGYCVKLFDAAKGTHIHDFSATQKGVATAVVFSGDGKRLAAFIGDQGKPGITVWDVTSKEPIRRITGVVPGGNTSSVRSLAFLPDNKTLAAGCSDYHLHLFDVSTGQRVGVFPRAFRIGISDVFVVADGQLLLNYIEAEGLVQLWKPSDALPTP